MRKLISISQSFVVHVSPYSYCCQLLETIKLDWLQRLLGKPCILWLIAWTTARNHQSHQCCDSHGPSSFTPKADSSMLGLRLQDAAPLEVIEAKAHHDANLRLSITRNKCSLDQLDLVQFVDSCGASNQSPGTCMAYLGCFGWDQVLCLRWASSSSAVPGHSLNHRAPAVGCRGHCHCCLCPYPNRCRKLAGECIGAVGCK